MTRETDPSRRALLGVGLCAPALLVAGPARLLLAGADPATDAQGEQDVSTVEDLMREHGVLRRVLLVYEDTARRIGQNAQFPVDSVAHAATLVRRFVEEYHEKLEEDYLFPRFRKAGTLVDLVTVLDEQHKRGRALTSEIEKLAAARTLSPEDRTRLRDRLESFVRMYAPHAAREDTVLFPAFKKLVSPKEYDALGDEFEKKERELFGKDGFEASVEQVAGIEKEMRLYDLAQFTPKA